MRVRANICLFAAICAGCVSHDSSWTRIPGRGPYLGEARYAQVFRKCEQRLMDGARQCEIAFADGDHGSRVEVFHDLVGELDSYLARLPASHSWGTTNSSPQQTRVPYKLFLVTILPSIVVAVPSPPAKTENCWVDAPEGNCLRSYFAAGNSYVLSTTTPATAGSFWFSPGITTDLIAIPVGATTVQLPLKGINAKLERRGEQWQFVRSPNG
jgi:hypothetical protein